MPIPKKSAYLVVIAALLLLTGVGAGAIGSHALRGHVPPELIEIWRTAVQYQLVHGLGLFFIALLASFQPKSLYYMAAYIMLAGTLIFSGSLYHFVLGGLPALIFLTPVGGTLFLLSWLILAIAAWPRRQ